MNDRQDSIYRLEEIQIEIEELAREAYDIVNSENSTEGSRANAYWLPSIVGNVTSEHEWIGAGSMTTLQDSIDALKDDGTDDFDGCFCPKCGDKEPLEKDTVENALYCPRCGWSDMDQIEEK